MRFPAILYLRHLLVHHRRIARILAGAAERKAAAFAVGHDRRCHDHQRPRQRLRTPRRRETPGDTRPVWARLALRPESAGWHRARHRARPYHPPPASEPISASPPHRLWPGGEGAPRRPGPWGGYRHCVHRAGVRCQVNRCGRQALPLKRSRAGGELSALPGPRPRRSTPCVWSSGSGALPRRVPGTRAESRGCRQRDRCPVTGVMGHGMPGQGLPLRRPFQAYSPEFQRLRVSHAALQRCPCRGSRAVVAAHHGSLALCGHG